MDEMASAQFRRQYAKLTKPTIVTVNGHPIGTWTPGFGKQFAEGMRTAAAAAQEASENLAKQTKRGK